MLDNEIYVLAAGAAEWKTPSFLIPVEEVDEVDEVEDSSARRLSASVTDTTRLYTGVDGGAGLQD